MRGNLCSLTATLLLLTTCGFQVDDLGEYWNKGELDPAFEGKWLDDSGKRSEVISVVRMGGMYRVGSLNEKEKHETELVKMLRLGPYTFVMSGPRSTYTLFGVNRGSLDRYEVKDGMLFVYEPKIEAFRRFLKENYPQDINFSVHDCKQQRKGDWCWEDVEIKKLNAETLKIISEVPNDSTYWDGGPLLKKIDDRMQIIELDATHWTTVIDIYRALNSAFHAPDEYATSLDGLLDMMVWDYAHQTGYQVRPPYTVVIRNTKALSKDIRNELELIVRSLSEARDEFLDRKYGRILDINMEVLP